MSKLTAIEWLVEQLWKHSEPSLTNKILIEQAKQMELKAKKNTYTEEQVREAFKYAYLIGEDDISEYDAELEAKEYIQSLKQPKQ